ncbi:unnamed protein product [Caenorhabditis angaria]|uniref:Ground-like domain-containing protein n=1 Tax=Caenorhabditis angaria TaxID=860376 RepID=A0A9P1INA8_9PELO|nr:unnamed protein product [Caenorhabditis angaria]
MFKIFVLLILVQVASSLFFPSVSPSGGCGCGCAPPPPPCGCGGRKKREVGHVRGHLTHLKGDSSHEMNNQCNSQELSEVILKHLSKDHLKQSRDAIYKELDAAYPENMFTVICMANATASFQADAAHYCLEGNENGHCYVFGF